MLSLAIAALVPIVVAAAGWGAFLTLQRATPAELTAARALGVIDKIRLVDSIIHVQGGTVRGECLSGRFRADGAPKAVVGEFLVLSNGQRILDVGHGPHDLGNSLVPVRLLQAEWVLAGCSGVLRATIGRRLVLRLPVAVQPVRRGPEQLLRISLPVGSQSTAYLFQPVTGMPRRIEYAGGGLRGWSELQVGHVSQPAVRRLVALFQAGRAAHRR